MNNYLKSQKEVENLLELYQLASTENNKDVIDECEKNLNLLLSEIKITEAKCFLSNENDSFDSYLEIHAGAGGTESQDWASMLRRMYMKWADKKNYKLEIISEHRGEEAGIKSSTIKICGSYVYGWLKSESGIHRLVRISPFDSGARRHTSFASVWVYPVVDDSIKIDIQEKDLRIDTYRSSGAGGQHVNTTDSAVRITHIPTGLVVSQQDEKSQHKNKAKALKILRSRVLDKEIQLKDQERAKDRKSQVGTGDRSERIRTYNFPQGRVSDHRINLTLYNLSEILEGQLDELIIPLCAEAESKKLSELNNE